MAPEFWPDASREGCAYPRYVTLSGARQAGKRTSQTAWLFFGNAIDNKRLDAVSPPAAIFTRVQKFAMALT